MLVNLRQIRVVDGLAVGQVCLKDIIHIDGPQLLVSESLPWFRDEVDQDILFDELGCRFFKCLTDLGLDKLDVSQSYENLKELKSFQSI